MKMKRLAIIVLVVLMMIPSFALGCHCGLGDPGKTVSSWWNESIIGQTVRVVMEYVSVRNGPGLTYTKIGMLKKDTKVTVIDVAIIGSATWYMIRYNGGNGWISAGYVDVIR